ncbi:MAG: DUF937 domain-containing protein [Caldilineaceae bacterium]|nr:DUF937 domain-containing protein [Caldilineaceae bacterium]
MNLTNLITQQFSDQAVTLIANKLGVDEKTAKRAAAAALPLLMGALARNAQSPQGARSLYDALAQDHNGSILSNVTDALSSQSTLQDGDKILNHVFGTERAQVDKGVSQMSGLSAQSSDQLMSMLAPIAMGVLGQQQQQNGLNVQDLTSMLSQEQDQIMAGDFNISSFLDMDGDGRISDDVASLGGKLLKSFFGRR